MSKIETVFENRKAAGLKVNIAYITPEYPFDDLTLPLCRMLSENNVQIIEIGVPFSDPLADGPTIQKSSYEALRKNVNIDKILKIVKNVRYETDVAIVLMTYINPVLSFGLDKFIDSCLSVGVDGLIIPDLPLDEIDLVKTALDLKGLDLIMLAAPTTPPERLENIASNSRGFIYCVSVTGVTGIRKSNYVDSKTIAFLDLVRSCSKIPTAVGFGLSKPEQLKKLAPYTDGFIIGSALIKTMEQAKSKEDALNKAKAFINRVFSD